MQCWQGGKGKKANQAADLLLCPQALHQHRVEKGGHGMGSASPKHCHPGEETQEEEAQDEELMAEIEFTTALINRFNKHTEIWEAIEVRSLLCTNSLSVQDSLWPAWSRSLPRLISIFALCVCFCFNEAVWLDGHQ